MLSKLPHTVEHLPAVPEADKYGTPNGKYSYPDVDASFKGWVQPRSSKDDNTGADREVSVDSWVLYAKKLPESFSRKSRFRWGAHEFDTTALKSWDAGPGVSYVAVELREVSE